MKDRENVKSLWFANVLKGVLHRWLGGMNLSTVFSLAGSLSVLAQSGFATSPFVQDRSSDLVDWREWCDDTISEFKGSNKIGLLLISHEYNSLSKAMGKETFSNEEIANSINENFFPILVDKAIHPEVSDFFANYLWRSKQLRGWPITAFVTPDFLPLEIGGYFPPTDDWGSQGLASIIKILSEQWDRDRERLLSDARRKMEDIRSVLDEKAVYTSAFDSGFLALAIENLGYQFDETFGGFGIPPKRVSFEALELLDVALAHDSKAVVDKAAKMRTRTLEAMLAGAVRDYVRGGFFSASTEESWSIPEFSKDALTQISAIEYLSSYPEYKGIVSETADALLRDFSHADGLIAAHMRIEPTDGKGSEMVAHTWTYAEIGNLLGDDELEAFENAFAISRNGNVSQELDVTGEFTGRNILRARTAPTEQPDSVKSALGSLRQASQSRNTVLKEQLVSGRINFLAASALAKAGSPYREAADRLMDKAIESFWDAENLRLKAASIDGVAVGESTAMDWALLIRALLDVGVYYPNYLNTAKKFQATFDDRFRSSEGIYLLGGNESSWNAVELAGFFEYEYGSVNSVALENLRRLEEFDTLLRASVAIASIAGRLPEDFSFSPEQFPKLLKVLFVNARSE